MQPTPKMVKAAREKLALTQKQAAERFGYSVAGWIKKETEGESGRALSIGEFEFLLLLADMHPDYVLHEKRRKTHGNRDQTGKEE
ncbi:hypothetical protein CYR55_22875 [Chimaeribacter californicus]|uniref:Uncharacterized protein n=1 Tax=Chimaeribacter californicus TaxID=2060067 RepID=A0A2N5DSS2_9GAMM|nr:hypothetical protein [Chimaeribacter californicus]PLR29261.1 hypothetical protein CYR55_22875 [Chimaeribacter californicus]